MIKQSLGISCFLIIFMINGQKMEKYLDNVGDIQFNPKIDDSKFKVCNPGLSFQYYNFSKGLQYRGEKYEILRVWKEKYAKSGSCNSETGYITVRFLVNCEGKTGLFRIQQMDQNYKEFSFNEDFINLILDFVKEMDGWIVNEYRGRKVDYYQYLTFKVEDGNVKEILP